MGKITLNDFILSVKDEFSKSVLVALSDRMIEKHMLGHTWLSGCSTVVYPIMMWNSHVEVQLDGCKCNYTKCIKRIVDKNPNLFRCGSYIKGDGSCPSVIRFYYV